MRFFERRSAIALVAVWGASCATAVTPPDRAATADRTPPTSLGAPKLWAYEVEVDSRSEVLEVRAALPAGVSRSLAIEPGLERFVIDLALEAGEVGTPIERDGEYWDALRCAVEGCRLRYRFLLAEAAEAIDDYRFIVRYPGAVIAPPSSWLIHPAEAGPDDRFRFHVHTAESGAFVSGVLDAKDGAPGTYEARAVHLPRSPYSVFGELRIHRIAMPEGVVEVAILPGELEQGEGTALRWVTGAAKSVSAYFGRYPVARALVVVIPTRGRSQGFATALGNGGASILAPIGRATTETDFARDWQMTHEMVHLGFPNLPRRHHWLEEGVATYVEPIARARLGLVSAEDLWRGLLRGLPNGLPSSGDRGLDRTPTWGRTYWGGALFCLLADLEIRERTQNARSFDHALRGILRAGGDITVGWPIERTLEAADRATETSVVSALYRRMADQPVEVDLPALFRKLGVVERAGRIVFDDRAPWAEIRRAITRRTQ